MRKTHDQQDKPIRRMMDTSQENRVRQIRRILVLILFLNWGVAIAKIVYGFLTNFNSMLADGLHSLSDGVSNILGLMGITLACQPADKDHPYGHKKYETFFSLLIGVFLIIVALNLFIKGIQHLRNPVIPRIDALSFIIMLITTSVNVGVMLYEYRKGKALQSDILISDSLHTKADIFTSFSVIAALAAIKLGYPIFDPMVTIVISLFIAHAAFSIIKESSNVLCDMAVIMDNKKIAAIVRSIKGVKTCHRIRTRGRPDDIHVDLHVHVSPEMHIDKAHAISSRIEEAIKRVIPGVSDVVVHIEPAK